MSITSGSTIYASDMLNSETTNLIKSQYYVPDNCKVGDTVILDGIECLCVATGVTIQGSNLTRIAVDKNHELGYYQKYVGITQDGTKISQIKEWRWGSYGTSIGGTSLEVGYGLLNTSKCLANIAAYTSGSSTDHNTYPLMWLGVNDFISSHSNKWFVPSAYELKNYIYKNINYIRADNVTGSYTKWISSSESSENQAKSLILSGPAFLIGNISDTYKYANSGVRLCRVF